MLILFLNLKGGVFFIWQTKRKTKIQTIIVIAIIIQRITTITIINKIFLKALMLFKRLYLK